MLEAILIFGVVLFVSILLAVIKAYGKLWMRIFDRLDAKRKERALIDSIKERNG